MIPVELSRLVINERSDEQILFLKEKDGERELKLVLRIVEALLINRFLEEVVDERPLTHDLLLESIAALGGSLTEVQITGQEGEVYLAALCLKGSEESLIDARPSDAVLLALKADVPIMAEESLFEEGKQEDG